MRSHFLLLAAVMLLAPAAFAQAQDSVDCANANSTIEMNYCAEQDYDAADDALNEAYQNALAIIKDSDNPPPYDSKSWEEELRKAQRAWIAFRDAECKGLVPMEWSGGTGTTLAVLNCLTRLTRYRTATLRERYGAG